MVGGASTPVGSDVAKIKRLWQDINFDQAFAGASTFYKALKKDEAKYKFKNLTYKLVLDTLASIPTYIMHVRKKKRYETRHVKFEGGTEGGAFVTGQGQVMQMDLAEMPVSKDEPHRYILVLIDMFNLFLYAKALLTKDKPEVLKAIKSIKEEGNLDRMALVYSDEGNEFTSNRDALAKLGVRLCILRNKNKAFQAENAIRTLKYRLYRATRNKYTDRWSQFLEATVKNINATPSRAIGYLAPDAVNSPFSDDLVRKARVQYKQTQRSSGKQLRKPPASDVYNVGDLVYADIKDPKQFNERSFNIARDEVFQIVEVDKSQKPYLYTIANELDATMKKKRKFYAGELRPGPKKTDDRYYEVGGEHGTRIGDDGKEEVLVSWKYYPNHPKEWIKKSQFVGSAVPVVAKKKKKKK